MLIKRTDFICLNARKAIPAALLLSVAVSTIGCGKRKPPQPPAERVVQRAEISGFQRGDQVNLSWRLPVRNASGGSMLNIDRVEVYRLAESIAAPLSLDEEEFAARATLITSLPVTQNDFERGTFSFSDTLQFAGQPARLRYSIRFVNREGQRAAFSNFLLVEPAARVAEAPSRLRAEIAEDAVRLLWDAPKSNIDGTEPPNILGYNLYRSDSKTLNFKALNRTPVSKTEFADEAFEFGVDYKYFVRSVSLGSGGEPVESADSNIADAAPRDVFPPSPPSALTIAAAPGTISIFFASNPERDVVGYRLFRTTDQTISPDQWRLLTPDLLTANTFQDKDIESGKTYFYYLTAIDRAGNSSRPSEIVSETAP